MYVAACSLDKSIRMFDFFSGELIAQVAGHSDNVTGVRFSPDGKRLFTIGGDGCILVWKLGSSIVSAMRDRLMELYSSAQRKNQRVHASQSDLVAVPPIPPAETGATQLSNEWSNFTPTEQAPLAEGTDLPEAIRDSIPVESTADTIVMPRAEVEEDNAEPKVEDQNPWAVKAIKDGGYELFGQNFLRRDLQSKRERNKFTAQLTTALDTRVSVADEGDVIRIADPLEIEDDVNQGSDEGDSEDLFKGHAPPEEEYLELDPSEMDNDLENASSRLDTLELSVGHLENCLEDKVRLR